MVMTRLPAAIASRCMISLLAKLASPTCAMFAPGSPSSISARTGIAVAEALVEIAHVEMGVERDQPDLLQRQAESEHARAGHRIVAADEQGQRMRATR